MPSEIVHRSCPTCEASCGLVCEIDRDSRKVLSIEGDPDDPRSKGYLCPKAWAMQQTFEDPDRLREPLRKCPDGSWESIDWETALDTVAARLREIRDAHGADSLGYYIGNPTGHNVGGQLYIPALIGGLGTQRSFSAATMDQFPQNVALRTMLGDAWMFPIPDLDRCDFLVCMGGNPLVSQGSLMSAPNARRRLRDLCERGGEVVVIDPRRSETAEIASQHVFIRPGSDAFFLLSVCQVLFAEGLVAPGRVGDFVDGLDRIESLVADFPPEAVAAATRVDPDITRALVRRFAAAGHGAWYGRIGLCTQEFGTLASWLVYVVNVLSGRLDEPGGMMFPRPATGNSEPGPSVGPIEHARYRTAARGIPEVDGQLPCGLMAEEIETASAGDARMRGLVTVCGNPVLSAPNGPRLSEALDELDFMVAVDIYLNETTRHADVILPSTVQLEHENYDFLFQTTAVRNFARWSPRFFEPEEGTMDHWRILTEIGARMQGVSWEQVDDLMLGGMLAQMVGPDTGCPDVSPEAARNALGEERGPLRFIDAMLRVGPYGDKFDPEGEGLNLARLREAPHGVDLGALERRLPEALKTPGRRIDLAPDYVLQDIPRLREALATRSREDSLVLVGRRQLRNMNSWLHNLPALASGSDRCRLLVHSEDAKRLGLSSGGHARVRSRSGEVIALCEVSDEMMPGVVSLPHGFGHAREGTRLAVAQSQQAGVSSNDLTDEQVLDVPSGTHVANGIPVVVESA